MARVEIPSTETAPPPEADPAADGRGSFRRRPGTAPTVRCGTAPQAPLQPPAQPPARRCTLFLGGRTSDQRRGTLTVSEVRRRGTFSSGVVPALASPSPAPRPQPHPIAPAPTPDGVPLPPDRPRPQTARTHGGISAATATDSGAASLLPSPVVIGDSRTRLLRRQHGGLHTRQSRRRRSLSKGSTKDSGGSSGGEQWRKRSPSHRHRERQLKKELKELQQTFSETESQLWDVKLLMTQVQEENRQLRAAIAKTKPKRTLPPRPLPQWEWQANATGDWFPFAEADCLLLETTFPAGSLETRNLTFNQEQHALYRFDFNSMTQVNLDTGEAKPVRRVVPELPSPTAAPAPARPKPPAITIPESLAVPGNASQKTFAATLRSPRAQPKPVSTGMRLKDVFAAVLSPMSATAGSEAGFRWSESMQDRAVHKLSTWMFSSSIPSWCFEADEFAEFASAVNPAFRVPSGDTLRSLHQDNPVQQLTVLLKALKEREDDKTAIMSAFDSLVEVCDPAALQKRIREWLESRGQTEGGGGDIGKYGDGMADAKAPEEVKHIPFYERNYQPPFTMSQTVENLATWYTPQGIVWSEKDIAIFRGNCALMMYQHSADQSDETVLPLYLYSVSLYHIYLWSVWVSPKRAPPRGRWAGLRCPQLQEEFERWERPYAALEAEVATIMQPKYKDLEKFKGEVDDQEYAGMMEKVRREEEYMLRVKIDEKKEAGGQDTNILKLNAKWFESVAGLQVPDNAVHMAGENVKRLGYNAFLHGGFCVLRFENKRRGTPKWSPTWDTTAWLPPFEIQTGVTAEPVQVKEGKIKKGKKSAEKAALRTSLSDGMKVVFERLLKQLPPPGLLDYIHSRRAEEHLRWAMPSWECRPAISRAARNLIDRCYTVADQQKYDSGLDKDFRALLRNEKALLPDFLQPPQLNPGFSEFHRTLAAVKCEAGTTATPQVIAHSLDIQHLMYEGVRYLLSFSGSRFAIMNCGNKEVTELFRVKDGCDDQPYWHLNYAMRMRQMGKNETVLTVTGEVQPGRYLAPDPPPATPANALDDASWGLPVDLLGEESKELRARWDRKGGPHGLGGWEIVNKAKGGSGVKIDANHAQWALGTWILPQLVPLIYYTDRAMVSLAGVPEQKVGYQVCPEPKGIKNYRGLANVKLPSSIYGLGKVVLWGQYSSSTTDRGVASAFAAGDSSCAVFTLLGKSCRCIAQWSRFAREKEWLYPPGVKFRVTSALTEEQQQILGRQNLQMFSMEEIDEFESLEIYVRATVPFVASGDGGAEHVMQLFKMIQHLVARRHDDCLAVAIDPLLPSMYGKAGQSIICRLSALGAKRSHYDTALHKAARKARVDAIQSLLDPSTEPPLGNTANVNSRDPNGHTALHLAALDGNVGCVKQLLLARAKPGLFALGFLPIEYAALRKDEECVRVLRTVTPGCSVPQKLIDYKPGVLVLDEEVCREHCEKANMKFTDAMGAVCGAHGIVGQLEEMDSERYGIPIFNIQFGDDKVVKFPATCFRQKKAGGGTQDDDDEPVQEEEREVEPMSFERPKEEIVVQEDFQLFVLRTTLDVAQAPAVFKYVLDQGVASVVKDMVQQLVQQMPANAVQFMRDYFQDRLRTSPLGVLEYRNVVHGTAFIVYFSNSNAQLRPAQRKVAAQAFTNPLLNVSPFSGFAMHGIPPQTEEEQASHRVFMAASCDVRHMFPVHKRLAHVFMAMIGRRIGPFTSGSDRDPADDIIYHIPQVHFNAPQAARRASGLEFDKLSHLADRDIVLNAQTIDETAARTRAAGVQDTVWSECFPTDPEGPPAALMYGPGEFRISGREIRHLESTVRIATTHQLPPRLFNELAAMCSDPLRAWFFSLTRAVPIMEIDQPEPYEEMLVMYSQRYQHEKEATADCEVQRKRAVGKPGADMVQYLNKLGAIDYELQQHRLWRDNAKTHIEYLKRTEACQQIALQMARWRDGVLAAPHDYAFDTEEQVAKIFEQSLTELACNVCISMQGYSFVDGLRGACNQLTEKTPEPIVFVSACGIDFNAPNSTLREAPKYFLRNKAELDPGAPPYEGWKGWKRGGQDRLLERLKETYRIIFDSLQHHGVRNPCMLPMGLGVFLLNVNELDRADVKDCYFRAQYELLAERDYGFENYYINAAAHGGRAKEILERGLGEGEGGFCNAPLKGRMLRCNIIFHDRDVKFLAVELARTQMSPGLLNPCDCAGLFFGLPGNNWETGRAMYYVGEEDIGATTTLTLSHVGISDSITRAGCIIHEGSRTVSRPARPQRLEVRRKIAEQQAAEEEKQKEGKHVGDSRIDDLAASAPRKHLSSSGTGS
eukprot:TRINITY_DN130_c0_g4_i2.p1 TRINITY_DN130_c0_g4~~TRINITY_DN130_c0_g4_i2.p1  ORF type:complete len:2307 (+),score=528.68 TRINITY_DN130_c0_g4_i2:69-6989(+)